MFVDDLGDIGRVLVVGSLAYAALLLILRGSGKRTLSKMNAFDLVVTVALGSTLATVLLSPSVALVEGAVAFALLAALQALVSWLSLRSAGLRRVVKAEPRLLVRDGRLLEGAMHDERVLREEILQALRGQGVASLDAAQAVVLETDGSLSVIPSDADVPRGTLADVRR